MEMFTNMQKNNMDKFYNFFTEIVAPKIWTEFLFLYILTKSNTFITHSSGRYPNYNGNKLHILTLLWML